MARHKIILTLRLPYSMVNIEYLLTGTFIFLHFSISDAVLCKHCGALLINDLELLVNHCRICPHMFRPDTSYNHTCMFCDYHVNKRDKIVRHLSKHTGFKPYFCPFCPHKASRKDNLTQHMLIKHWENIQLVQENL